MGAVAAHNAGHCNWGGGCDGWRLRADDGLSVIEERMPPGTVKQRQRHVAAPLEAVE